MKSVRFFGLKRLFRSVDPPRTISKRSQGILSHDNGFHPRMGIPDFVKNDKLSIISLGVEGNPQRARSDAFYFTDSAYEDFRRCAEVCSLRIIHYCTSSQPPRYWSHMGARMPQLRCRFRRFREYVSRLSCVNIYSVSFSWHAYAHATCSNKYCVEFVAVLPCYASGLYLDCGKRHGIAAIERPPAKLSKRLIYSHGTQLAARQCSALIRRGESGLFVRLGLRRAASSLGLAGEPTSSRGVFPCGVVWQDISRCVRSHTSTHPTTEALQFGSAGEPTSSPADRRRQRQRFSEAAARRCVRAALSKQRRWERFILRAVTLSNSARFVSPDRGRIAGGVEHRTEGVAAPAPPPVAPFRVQSRT